jgi:hypothetical protein
MALNGVAKKFFERYNFHCFDTIYFLNQRSEYHLILLYCWHFQ